MTDGTAEEPKEEQMFVLDLPPPQEPEDDGHVDDWSKAPLYRFVEHFHFEKMLKKGLI